MATDLDTPVPLPNVTQQGVVKVQFSIPHKRNAGNTAMEIDRANVEARYVVETWTQDGDSLVTARASRIVPWADWPAGFKAQMRDVYASIVQDAKANGLIGAGTDEPLD